VHQCLQACCSGPGLSDKVGQRRDAAPAWSASFLAAARPGAVAAPCKPAGAAPVPSPCQRPRSRAAGRGSNARVAPSHLTLNPTQAEVVFNKDKQGAPMEAMLKVLDGKLTGRTFLVGEAVSAADVALASHLLFFRVFMPQVPPPGPRLPRAALQRGAPECQRSGRSQRAVRIRSSAA
jgi:hypothetical protein